MAKRPLDLRILWTMREIFQILVVISCRAEIMFTLVHRRKKIHLEIGGGLQNHIHLTPLNV